MHNKNLIKKYLEELLNIPSPTGYTGNICEYIKSELKELKVDYKTSNKGIIVATIDGINQDEETTFSSHIDTLGAMVKEIKSNGRLSVSQIGGYMMNSIEGENCIIHTRNEKCYEGTLQTIRPSIHIHGNDARELPRDCKNYEVIIDEEVFSKDDILKLGIDIGDIISFDTRTRITKSDFIKSRYLDDKASVAAILYAIKYIKLNNIKPKNTINFLFSNYEEVGHGSSAFIPKNTTEFIAVDMGCPGEGQNSTEYDVCICTKDSNGPYDYDLVNRLISTCKSRSINYKLDIYPNYGSDATAALKSGMDAKFALIGPGVFSSHGYERTHIKSIIETINLIIAYIS
ncbi:M42 family metallopeptidase [Romboutsia lituseburensis]|uniref:Putative aminopeptidase FrvX n=1 Tax=Romboutsia lituseburensis DSM 797 TaxID=1121325 RepID=A0A1G9L9R3_9FIRM|nr:M42 family metallopeptidase [Romboutsia lituseburensis]CEH35221.1 Glutamyl aminopeptidase protein [Romboutsia lituseburensis]SDL58487.1 Putative aminopeptidase FrvX [Romboutsia lituseburensis DSM 797]